MAFCVNCGGQLHAGAKFCPACGAQAAAGGAQYDGHQGYQDTSYVPPRAQSPAVEVNQDAGFGAMSALAYSGILFLVPMLAGKASRFAMFHANQGLVLLLSMIAYGIAHGILTAIFVMISPGIGLALGGIMSLGYCALTVFAIIGLVNTCRGLMKPLPLIGGIQLVKYRGGSL